MGIWDLVLESSIRAGQTCSRNFAVGNLLLCADQLDLNSVPLCLVCYTGIVFEDMVHLFQGAALGFWDEEVGPDSSQDAKYGEENVGAIASVLYERGCYQALQ
mgnify:CR=1 FL=1